MTTTRDELREAAEGHLRYGGGGDDLANGVLVLLDQLEAAEARIKAVRELHKPTTVAGFGSGLVTYTYCTSCTSVEGWRCATIRALDGDG